MPIKTAYLIYRVCCFLVNKVSSAVKRPGIDKNKEERRVVFFFEIIESNKP